MSESDRELFKQLDEVTKQINIPRCPRFGRALVAEVGSDKPDYCWSYNQEFPEDPMTQTPQSSDVEGAQTQKRWGDLIPRRQRVHVTHGEAFPYIGRDSEEMKN